MALTGPAPAVEPAVNAYTSSVQVQTPPQAQTLPQPQTTGDTDVVPAVLGGPVLLVGADGAASWSYTVPGGAELVYYEVRWLANAGRDLGDWSGKQNRVFYDTDVMSYDIAGLQAGVEYKIMVFAGLTVNGQRRYAKSNIVMLTPLVTTLPTDNSPPGSVGDLTAVRGDGGVMVSWDAAELADSYEINYSADGKVTWQQAAEGHTGTTFVLGDVEGGKEYVVGVRAVNTAGMGIWVHSDVVPAVLGGPVLLVGADGAASWSYTVPGGAELVYYEVRWLANAGRDLGDWSGKQNRVFYDTDVMSYDIAGLQAGVEYKIMVFAGLTVNGQRRYAKSNIVMLTPLVTTLPTDNSPPGSVGDLTAVRGDGGVMVSWDAAELADSYEINYSADGKVTWQQAAEGHTGTTFVLGDVEGGKEYVVGVRAVNTAGMGIWVHSDVVPAVLGGPVLLVGADGAASWSYTVPGGAELVYYEVRWLANAGRDLGDWSGKQNRVFYDTDVMSYDIAGLQAGVEYKIMVFAGLTVNGQRRYAKSNIVMLTPLVTTLPTDNSPPGSVGDLTAVRGDGGVMVSWDAAELADSYEINYSADGKVTWQQAAEGHTGTTFVLGDVEGGKEYVVGVRAVNTAGMGIWVHSDVVPAVLGGPVLLVGADGAASWSYTVPGGAELVYYEVRWLANAGRDLGDWSGKQNRVFYDTDVMSYDIAGLQAGVEYKIMVFAGLTVNGQRRYAKSNIVMLTP